MLHHMLSRFFIRVLTMTELLRDTAPYPDSSTSEPDAPRPFRSAFISVAPVARGAKHDRGQYQESQRYYGDGIQRLRPGSVARCFRVRHGRGGQARPLYVQPLLDSSGRVVSCRRADQHGALAEHPGHAARWASRRGGPVRFLPARGAPLRAHAPGGRHGLRPSDRAGSRRDGESQASRDP